jgi:hypothetical protein
MGAAISGAPTTFSDRVLKFLERVEHRVASNPTEREAAFRLRYNAYRSVGFLKPRTDNRLYDPLYDDDPTAWISMSFVDGELAGTVRVNVGNAENAVLPGLQVFSDILAPRLRARQTIVEFTRLAAKISLSNVHPELPYVIMRPGFMAAQHLEADFAVATPREEHIAFYKRAFGAAVWCAPRDYPGLTAKLACMGRVQRRATGHRSALFVLQVHRGRTGSAFWGARSCSRRAFASSARTAADMLGRGGLESGLSGAFVDARALQTGSVEGVCVERRFAQANLASAAPAQKIPEADRD